MKRLLALLGLAALPAACYGGMMAYVAAQHNPQGEFDAPNGDLSTALLFHNVFLPWFLGVFLLTGIMAVTIWLGTRERPKS